MFRVSCSKIIKKNLLIGLFWKDFGPYENSKRPNYFRFWTNFAPGYNKFIFQKDLWNSTFIIKRLIIIHIIEDSAKNQCNLLCNTSNRNFSCYLAVNPPVYLNSKDEHHIIIITKFWISYEEISNLSHLGLFRLINYPHFYSHIYYLN